MTDKRPVNKYNLHITCTSLLSKARSIGTSTRYKICSRIRDLGKTVSTFTYYALLHLLRLSSFNMNLVIVGQ